MTTAEHVPIGAMLLNSNMVGPLPGRGQAHADYLRGFAACIEARGARPSKLLEPYGIDPFSLEQSGGHLSCHTVVELLERSSRATNDSMLGFRLAEAQQPDVLGCAVPLARAAADFGSAVEQLIKYLPCTHSQESNLELVVGRQSAELRWSSPVELEYCEQAYYHHLFIVHKLLNMLTDGKFRAQLATLRCDVRAGDVVAMGDAMACPIEAKSEVNRIAFDRELLLRPLHTANGVAFSILRTTLDMLVTASSENLMARVRAYAIKALPTGQCTIEACASTLGTSSRTLQKRLTEQDTTFSQVVEQTKIDTAMQQLTIRSRPLSEIAFDLGYSEHSCFTRAFKRWTGQTPEAFRQRTLSNFQRNDAPPRA